MSHFTSTETAGIPGSSDRITLSKSVSRAPSASPGWHRNDAELYGPDGSRKYTNISERRRFLSIIKTFEPGRALFARLLTWTGARVSEVLALTPQSFQIDNSIVTFTTLKRRKFTVREVPIPPSLMRDLDRYFGLRSRQRSEAAALHRLWPWSRVTAWRFIKSAMTAANVFGKQACPRGLRHGFGVATLQSGVPLNLIQRWMGHSRLSTTAIYANVCGPEEIAFARQFWMMDAPGGRRSFLATHKLSSAHAPHYGL